MYHVLDYITYQLRNPDQRKQEIRQCVGLLRSPWLGKKDFSHSVRGLSRFEI
jgi:hypothetical protein